MGKRIDSRYVSGTPRPTGSEDQRLFKHQEVVTRALQRLNPSPSFAVTEKDTWRYIGHVGTVSATLEELHGKLMRAKSRLG